MTFPLPPPLTNKEFATALDDLESRSIEFKAALAVKSIIADARWHRDALAKARAENERLREASEEAEAILTALTVWFDTGLGDVTMPRTGGKIKEDVEKVLVVVRAALAPEGEGG